MTILLTIIESDNSIISGVPEYVEFESSIPSTIFYTLDGSTPGEDDYIAVGRVYMPTHGMAFELKAIAISGANYSDIITESYSADSMSLDRTRMIDEEGITVLPAGEFDNFVDYLSVDSNGQEAQRTTIEFLDLLIKTDTTNKIGEPLSGSALKTETTHDFINIPDRRINQATPMVSSIHDGDFYPNAKVILIDGSTEELLNSQIVRILNRPSGTIFPDSKFYNEQSISRPLITGNFVRAMYNPNTGKAVYYYRESRNNRWVKSIQTVQPKVINAALNRPTFVFKWIEARSTSKIH